MAIQLEVDSPLAEALSSAVQTRLSEEGWTTGGADDSALGEYIILMLANGKTQDELAVELSTDLLSLPADDPAPMRFAQWLFQHADMLSQQPMPVPASQPEMGQNGQQFGDGALPDQGATIRGAAVAANSRPNEQYDTQMQVENAEEGDASLPRGPKALRAEAHPGNKRMMSQVAKAMDRSNDASLHRVRTQQGNERIDTRARAIPKGPRNDHVRNGAGPNSNFNRRQHGPLRNTGPTDPANTSVQMTPQQQMQLLALLEEQTRMMAQIIPNQAHSGAFQSLSQAGFNPSPMNPAKSLFDRVDHGPRHRGENGRRKLPRNSHRHPANQGPGIVDTAMQEDTNESDPQSPDTVCKFNLKCTNKDCIFAHQSPAAPAGTIVDVHDICPFGAACKNRKCVARHPSPFKKVAHASEQDCKYFPNCTNTTCPFRHPAMPVCRFGADCNRSDCQYTHVKTVCKFNPCLNPDCMYKHADGQQRGKFNDKVWTADSKDERKFVDQAVKDEELILPQASSEARQESTEMNERHPSAELVT